MSSVNNKTTRVFQALSPLQQTKSTEFSLLSFNILTKSFATKNYYHYVNMEHRFWSYRYPKLCEIISNYCSDIICLQECDPFSFRKDFGNVFKLNGYNSIIDLKDTKKAKYKNNLQSTQLIIKPATFWKINKFQSIYHDFRSRGIISLFKLIENKNNDNDIKYLFIVNVHLEGHPSKWDVRFAQIKSILSRIVIRCEIYSINPLKVPIIITGDFNDGIKSSIHQTLLNGGLSKDYYDKRFPLKRRKEKDCQQDYKHNFKFLDSYEYVFNNSIQMRPYTFAGNGIKGMVDFIYFTDNNINCYGVSQPLPNWMIMDSLILPNQNWISDHLPIAGVYNIISTNMIEKKEKKNNKKIRRQKPFVQHNKRRNQKNIIPPTDNNGYVDYTTCCKKFFHSINTF